MKLARTFLVIYLAWLAFIECVWIFIFILTEKKFSMQKVIDVLLSDMHIYVIGFMSVMYIGFVIVILVSAKKTKE